MDILITLFSLIILLFSVILHELAHGYAAYSLGDPTAKYAGRLTFNPLVHLDPLGSVILPLLLFISGSSFLVGWAKPVPINPYNFRDQKWGSLKVALAGPATNMAVALVFGFALRFLLVANFAAPEGILIMFSFIVQINIILALFNLIPIPPLDGHWILFSFLPSSFDGAKAFLQRYGFFILIFLLVFGGFGPLHRLATAIFAGIVGI